MDAKANQEASANQSNLQGPRAPLPQECGAVIAMLNQVFRIAQGRPPTVGSDWAHVYAPENLENVHAIFDIGATEQPTPVASAAVWINEVTLGQATLRVGGINAVGTLPEYRKHGLGAQVMDAAKQTMQKQGCAVGLLSTGIANWYRRMGWEWAGSTRNYQLNRGNIALLPTLRPGVNMKIIPLATGEGDVLDESVLQLYQQANFGGQRTLDQFRQLAAAKQLRHLVIAQEADETIAYLLTHEHRIVEWASRGGEGDKVDINTKPRYLHNHTDVIGLMRAYFEAIDDPAASASLRVGDSGGAAVLRQLTVQTPNFSFRDKGPNATTIQHPLVAQLDTLAIPYHLDYLGMVYVVEPQAILDAFDLSSQVQITPLAPKLLSNQSADQFLVQTPTASIEVGRSALTKLFFGPERIINTSAIFPLPFWQWMLERV